MTKSDNPWEDLVVAILSVNQYSLEKTYLAIDGIRRENITDPDQLASWETAEIEERLRAAGCDRGTFMTKLFAQRLGALASFVHTTGIERCQRVLAGNDMKAIEELLLPIKGIGPVVLSKFFLLRDLQSDWHRSRI